MNEQEIKIILYNYAINTTDILDQECMAIYDDVFDNLAKAIMDKIREETIKGDCKYFKSHDFCMWFPQCSVPNCIKCEVYEKGGELSNEK